MAHLAAKQAQIFRYPFGEGLFLSAHRFNPKKASVKIEIPLRNSWYSDVMAEVKTAHSNLNYRTGCVFD